MAVVITGTTITAPDGAIDAADLTGDLDASLLTGTLPAIDGSALTGITSTPSSTVIYVAQNTAPTGYLKANGAAISRTDYADLFAAIGTTFGSGDGSTTFDLPDLRGEFLRGWDDARGIDSSRTFGSAQADEIESHRHISPTIVGLSKTSSASAGVRLSSNEMTTSAVEGDEYNIYTENTGGTETRPRNIALLACIKY